MKKSFSPLLLSISVMLISKSVSSTDAPALIADTPGPMPQDEPPFHNEKSISDAEPSTPDVLREDDTSDGLPTERDGLNDCSTCRGGSMGGVCLPDSTPCQSLPWHLICKNVFAYAPDKTKVWEKAGENGCVSCGSEYHSFLKANCATTCNWCTDTDTEASSASRTITDRRRTTEVLGKDVETSEVLSQGSQPFYGQD